jgi:hypothetical protein
MAQTNYTPISLYYSATGSAVPLNTNLVDGELAININDGKLYYKDSGGTVQLLASKSGASGSVTSVSVVSANGLAGTVATSTTTPAITLSTTITGLLKGNGTAISAATSGTDYAPATSGSSILYGNGSGGFSNVTIGSGLSFTAGTLAATNAGTVTSVTASAPLASSGGATPNISFTGTLAVANGGTGQTSYTDGQLLIGNTTGNTLAKSTLTAGTGISITNGSGAITIAATSSGATITNDTTTSTNVYPVFAGATTGSLTTAYTSNAKLLYKPSTGEFQASEVIASNGLLLNSATVSASYTIATGNNAMSVGPITIASGQSVTVSSGQKWVVI